eukprot:JP439457.1.p4 GENE.JP439457.1~~JP439457.1.p4  ORF type:complete len:58 (+),score=6.36 JP439457.1:29-202(+)
MQCISPNHTAQKKPIWHQTASNLSECANKVVRPMKRQITAHSVKTLRREWKKLVISQ